MESCIEQQHMIQATRWNSKVVDVIIYTLSCQQWCVHGINGDAHIVTVDDLEQDDKLRIAKKYIKKSNAVINSLKDYQCQCNAHYCFINYGDQMFSHFL